ncbi:kinase-like protein [Atractiella rhizophila]|nr:kinase-like protein [Atractiella rhizophila]
MSDSAVREGVDSSLQITVSPYESALSAPLALIFSFVDWLRGARLAYSGGQDAYYLFPKKSSGRDGVLLDLPNQPDVSSALSFGNLVHTLLLRILSTLGIVEHAPAEVHTPTTPPSRDEVMKILETAPQYSQRVTPISQSFCVKMSGLDFENERAALELIATKTTIPVPKTYATFYEPFPGLSFGIHILLMEFIPSRTLEDAWETLSWFSRLRVWFTLRSYVRQLRQIRRDLPGPLVPCNEWITSFWSGIEGFKGCDYRELIRWLNQRITDSKRGSTVGQIPYSPKKFPLVFTHGDLNWRNVLLTPDGTIFLIDWQTAGFYPSFWEYAGMARYHNRKTPKIWHTCSSLITGYYPRQSDQLVTVDGEVQFSAGLTGPTYSVQNM